MLDAGLMEMCVHPEQKLTDELLAVLALSAEWLSSYFEAPTGGG
jgi:hypothetical protein